jgi:hypothetical protein
MGGYTVWADEDRDGVHERDKGTFAAGDAASAYAAALDDREGIDALVRARGWATAPVGGPVDGAQGAGGRAGTGQAPTSRDRARRTSTGDPCGW